MPVQERRGKNQRLNRPAARGEHVPVIKGEHRHPVVAVWREDWNIATGTDPGPFLITAIWEDGRVVWSKDNLRGGQPYYQGKVDRTALQKVLSRIDEAGAFAASWVRRTNFGPDSFCTGMFVVRGPKSFLSHSWHELAEQNPNVVASSSGLTSLQGKSREEFLKTDDKDYLKYRALWGKMRTEVASLIPKTGEKKGLSFELKPFGEPADPCAEPH